MVTRKIAELARPPNTGSISVRSVSVALAQMGGYAQNNGANADYEAQIGGDIANLGGGVLSLDGIYSWVKDAVSVAASALTAPNPIGRHDIQRPKLHGFGEITQWAI